MITKFYKSRIHYNTPITDNFMYCEFMCPCSACDLQLLDDRLFPLLEKLREKIGGVPIKINSGYRCPIHNASDKVKGSVNSQHLKGTAVDIKVPSDNNKKMLDNIVKYGEELGFMGIGRYPRWVHLDLRATRARW